MKRNEQVYEILHQILTEQQDLLQKISPEIYTRKILSLDGATIGGHTRHIIEFLEILLNSYYSSKINYDKRQRKFRIRGETPKSLGNDF